MHNNLFFFPCLHCYFTVAVVLGKLNAPQGVYSSFRHEGLVVILETLLYTWGVIVPYIVQPQHMHRDNILASGCFNEQISISYDIYLQQE